MSTQLILALGLVLVLALVWRVWWQMAPDPPARQRPDIELPERIIDDRRDEDGVGMVIVETEDGIAVYFFTGSIIPTDVSFHPVDGSRVVHEQRDTLEQPDGTDLLRWIVVTESGEGDDRETTVTIFEYDPNTWPATVEIAKHKHKGPFERALVNKTDHEKLFLFGEGGEDGWLLISLINGEELRASNDPLPPNIVSIEIVNRCIITIEKWNADTDIRLRVYGPDGSVISTVVMPGSYLTSGQDGHDLKAIVTVVGGTVFQDLLRVSTGTLLTQHAGNGMNGEHAHLQYDDAGGGRFVEIVYNRGRDETEVRIMDSAGNVMATYVLPGEFMRAVVGGTPPNEFKVIATERFDRATATVIDLTTANRGSTTEVNGTFEGLKSENGAVTLTAGGQTLPIN